MFLELIYFVIIIWYFIFVKGKNMILILALEKIYNTPLYKVGWTSSFQNASIDPVGLFLVKPTIKKTKTKIWILMYLYDVYLLIL